MEVLEVVRKRHYEHYDVRDEMWDSEVPGMEPHLMTKLAYNKQGDWIGSSKQAYRMVRRYGIQEFEKTEDGHCVCSIGYAPSSQKWYGWSHRAIFGFTIGSTCKKGDCHYIPESFAEIQVDCHCKKREGRLAMCHANATVMLVPAYPDDPTSALIPGFVGVELEGEHFDQACKNPNQAEVERNGALVEGIEKCIPTSCVFETGKGEWIAETMDDAKQMAIDFAKSVS